MCWRLSFAAQFMHRESDIRAHPLQTCDALRPQGPTLISWMIVWQKLLLEGAGRISAQCMFCTGCPVG